MKTLYAAIVLSLLMSPAAAQTMNLKNERTDRTPEELAKDKAVEDAYRAKMNKIPDQKVSSDPWGDVRSSTPAQGKPPTKKTN